MRRPATVGATPATRRHLHDEAGNVWARIPAEAERKPRAKQEKTPPPSVYRTTSEQRENATDRRHPPRADGDAAPVPPTNPPKRHFNKKIEKNLQKICTIKKRLPPLQRQKNKGIRQKYCAVFPRVYCRNSIHPATLLAGDSGKENGFFVNILKHKEND